MKMHKACLLLVLSFLSLFGGTALATGPLSKLSVIPLAERQAAPAFLLESLTGGKESLADYKGKLVLLNFWATWCMPCRQEMPSMASLWQKYQDQGLIVVAISLDEDARSRVASFAKIFKLSFPILLDPQSQVGGAYEVSGVPASYLIDRNGKLVARVVGSDDWSSHESFRLIEALLAE